MKKIDLLFSNYPEMRICEGWIRKTITKSERHPIKWVFKRFRIRTPKYYEENKKVLIQGHTNPFHIIGARMYFDHFYAGTNLLEHLNKCFAKLKNEDGFLGMIRNIKNAEQFSDTISEIEFNAYFSKRYPLKIEPKITYGNNRHKRLDSEIKLDKRKVLFEIVTPKLSRELLRSKKAIALKNRASDKILDKLNDQITPIKDSITQPLVIVINASYSEIDEITAGDALLGESQFTVYVPKDTSKPAIPGHFSRGEKSIAKAHPYGGIISAVIVYKRILHLWGMDFNQHIILNPNAKRPLTGKEYLKLKRFHLARI